MWEEEESSDGGERELVVKRLAMQLEECGERLDGVATSIEGGVSRSQFADQVQHCITIKYTPKPLMYLMR